MRPIFETSDDERSDKCRTLPPLRPCSTATHQSNINGRMFRRRVSFVDERIMSSSSGRSEKIKKSSLLEALRSHSDDYSDEVSDDSTIETIASASLFSLLNYKPKELTFADYIFCRASFHDIIEEAKGTWEDASSAFCQIINAFVITGDDIDRVNIRIVSGIREIEVSRW
eukprot:CCRYP_009318-RA/>CCRYP_009318-RA protein AED:0.06 eAED:-0.06 QI:0/-1/0/1/-1/0/1/0/169